MKRKVFKLCKIVPMRCIFEYMYSTLVISYERITIERLHLIKGTGVGVILAERNACKPFVPCIKLYHAKNKHYELQSLTYLVNKGTI